MKNLIIITLIFISCFTYSQNYSLDKKPKDNVKTTTDTVIYKGNKYPVCLSRNNKMFIYVTSKRGTKYRIYFK